MAIKDLYLRSDDYKGETSPDKDLRLRPDSDKSNITFSPPAGTIGILSGGPSVFVESSVNYGGGGPGLLLGLALNLQTATPASIPVPAGSVVVTGYAPTLGFAFSPANAALTISGTASSLGFGIGVPAAALAMTGLAPTPSVHISVGAGSIAVTGQVLTFVDGKLFQPAQGALVIAGLAPIVLVPTTIAVPAGSLTVTGLAPILDRGIYPGAGSIAVTGRAPTLGHGSYPGAGTLTITGWTPVPINSGVGTGGGGPGLLLALGMNLSYSQLVISPPTGSLTITGTVTVAGATFSFIPPPAALAITGWNPTPSDSSGPQTPVLPAPLQLTITGLVPQVFIGLKVVFPFLSNAQSFVGTPGTGTVMAWTGANGNPLGSLSTRTTGRNRNVTNVWTLATGWAQLGIPANTVITAVSVASADSRITEFTLGLSGTISETSLTPTGFPLIQLAASRAFSGTEAGWTTTTGSGASGLELPSGGSITLRAGSNLKTLNSGSPAVTALQDNINFVVTYTAAKQISPPVGALTITGLAPQVIALAAVSKSPAQAVLSIQGAAPSIAVLGVGGPIGFGPGLSMPLALNLTTTIPSPGGGGPGLLVGLGLNLEPTIGVREPGQAVLTITGYAPRIDAPIVLSGSDELLSERATLTSDGARIVKQGDHFIPVGKASLTVTGLPPVPSHLDNRYFAMPVTALTFTFYLPTLGIDHVRSIPAGAITATGRLPSINDFLTATPDAGTLEITGYAPEAFVSQNAEPDVGAITITGYAPSLAFDVRFSPGTGSLTITGIGPTLTGVITWPASGVLLSGRASTGATAHIKVVGSGVLQSQPPLLFVGSAARIVTGSGTLESGPASTGGNIHHGVTPILLSSGPARILARARVLDYEPQPRRLKPHRVNRYNVVLKSKPKKRFRKPRR